MLILKQSCSEHSAENLIMRVKCSLLEQVSIIKEQNLLHSNFTASNSSRSYFKQRLRMHLAKNCSQLLVNHSYLQLGHQKIFLILQDAFERYNLL